MSRINLFAAVSAVLVLLATALPGAEQGKSAKPAGKPVVALETTMGTIQVQLDPVKAPITTKNFLSYVNEGFYNGTIIHRIDFVIGLGGYTEALTGKPTKPGIKNESKNGLKNLRGTLAMARYDDPNSATSQFFINLKDNSHLDPAAGGFGYAVFGKVIEGMDVVDCIAKVKTGNKGPFRNIPLQTIIVKSAKLLSK
ncbi:MAG TPA: peptidylprolyl isomerase [Acidobacteriota bacterium]|nr:peptidylprolyl isomerase [Acidobacteriota bacterium]